MIKDVEQYPDAYQKERAERFGVCQKAIWQALKKLGLTYKKNSTSSESRRKSPASISTKKQQYEKEGKPIVFIDESGFPHDTPRTHGYSPKGQRCFGLKNWGAKGRTNVICALLGTTLFAIGLFDININSDVFYSWVTQVLIPELPKNSVIVMDNATFHKKHNIQQVIIDAGYMVEYLPTYSSDLNPIEHKWAQAKSKKQKKREWLRYRDFVLSPYVVIKIKSLSYMTPEALNQATDKVMRDKQQAAETIKQRIDTLQQNVSHAREDLQRWREEMKQRADKAAAASAKSALWLFITLLLGAIVSAAGGWWGVRSGDRYHVL